jgi:membrane protein implicated in regulation of membrane protease activity
MRVTALTGLVIALYNILVNFIFLPGVLWWNGILHLPLLFISLCALILAYRRVEETPTLRFRAQQCQENRRLELEQSFL